MDQSTLDQGWNQLQANIERFLKQSLQSDGRQLKYKPQFIATWSERPSEMPQTEEAVPHFRGSAVGNIREKGGL
jgi:hypothetical protein